MTFTIDFSSPQFWGGVIATVLLELAAIFSAAAVLSFKKNKGGPTP